jgi:hypothetical protein
MRTSSIFLASLSFVFAAALGVAGCDKSKPETQDPETTGAAADEGGGDEAGDEAGAEAGDEGGGDEGGGEVAWADMDRDQRMTHMGTVVLPGMKDAFKQQGFETFKCGNCHGEDYKEVDFKMPNDLTPLNPDNPIQSGMDLDEETTKFMVSTVLPQFAEMLDAETDVTTGKGEVGCLTCHLSE